MKKLFFLSSIAGILLIIACGPSAEEKAKKQREDSIRRSDSIAKANNPYKDAEIEIKTFHTGVTFINDDGKIDTCWGYDIYVFGGLLVHQPHIPAIPGNAGFKSEEKARKTAEFVVHKLRNNIMPPSVTLKELDSLGVLK